jgi:hypothetical protein
MHPTKIVVAAVNSYTSFLDLRGSVGGLLMTLNTPIAESHSWSLVCHLLKFTPVNFPGFIALESPVITKCLSGFWIIRNNSNLVMNKLIQVLRKRIVACIIGV